VSAAFPDSTRVCQRSLSRQNPVALIDDKAHVLKPSAAGLVKTVHRESSGYSLVITVSRLSKLLATLPGSAPLHPLCLRQWLFERLALRHDEPPKSHSTHPPAELLCPAGFKPDGPVMAVEADTRYAGHSPATREQAQARTVDGLARRRFRPARSDHLPALKRPSISGQFTTFHQALM